MAKQKPKRKSLAHRTALRELAQAQRALSESVPINDFLAQSGELLRADDQRVKLTQYLCFLVASNRGVIVLPVRGIEALPHGITLHEETDDAEGTIALRTLVPADMEAPMIEVTGRMPVEPPPGSPE